MTNPTLPMAIYLADREMFVSRLEAIDKKLDGLTKAQAAQAAVTADGRRRGASRRAMVGLWTGGVAAAAAIASVVPQIFS